MSSETKTCQNCKSQFIVEPEDFDFYKKMDVPPPTWCPECRMVRRMCWRNERSLYRRSCDACRREIVSMYTADAPFPVYCHDCWNSDSWDPLAYGLDFDPARPFFAQYAELLKRVPRVSLWQLNAVNSEFSNLARNCKEVYLSYSLVGGERIYYSKIIDGSAYNLLDCLSTADSENCYENVYGHRNYNSQFLTESQNCMDSAFLYDCANCRNCFMSANLRNCSFIFRGEQLEPEEYARRLEEEMNGSHVRLEELKKEFAGLRAGALHKYADILRSSGSTGDHILNARNAVQCFDVHDAEDVKYCFRILADKDTHDATFFGGPGELCYEYVSGGNVTQNIAFCMNAIGPLREVRYSDLCGSASNVFGCIGLRNKEYCVLNRQYKKEEYLELAGRIRKQMEAMPYAGGKGRVYSYGEFFPIEISPFAYNETIAQEYFPLSAPEAGDKGYAWREADKKQYPVTISWTDLPDNIRDAGDDILKATVECADRGGCRHQCAGAFRIVPPELQFYRQFRLPLPRLCPNCRHYARMGQTRPMKLWRRQCTCTGSTPDGPEHFHGASACPNRFESPYDPARPEVSVYCEQCYNSEVA